MTQLQPPIPAATPDQAPAAKTGPVDVTPPPPSGVRRWQVQHTTHYEYDQPVTRSQNLVRVRPIQDVYQRVVCHRVRICPEVNYREFEEVFGNRAGRFEIAEPHTSMTLDVETVVDVAEKDPFLVFPSEYRQALPVPWMPWERRLLEPFLEPPELPEAQLRALHAYAAAFSANNKRDLSETLFAINLEIFKQYEYTPGSTHVDTTPYEILQTRRGVCQDFAQLFITLARLLDIPARYVCGYLYTGGDTRPRSVPDATHAWVEVYLPEIGWKGLDPTNGCLPAGEHIRVATGRHYRDASPTTGWLEPAVHQTMTVAVHVSRYGDPPADTPPHEADAPPAAIEAAPAAVIAGQP